MGGDETAPRIDEDDVETLEHPEETFPASASPEEVDAEQQRQAKVLERQKAWVDPRETTGGEE